MCKFLNGNGSARSHPEGDLVGALSIKTGRLGQLSEGADADIAVFGVLHGKFGLSTPRIEADGVANWNGTNHPRWESGV